MQVAELKAAAICHEQQAWSVAQRAKREQQRLMAQLAGLKAEAAALTEDRYELQVCACRHKQALSSWVDLHQYNISKLDGGTVYILC